MSSAHVILLSDAEIEQIADGKLWADTEGDSAVIIAHERHADEIEAAVAEVRGDE